MLSLAALTVAIFAGAPPPVSVFADLDGSWAGTFVGYDATGKELYRIQVKQRYKTVDANTQVVTIEDKMPDGKVITGKGKNIATVGKDGKLVLKCIVEKSTGDRVEHDGRLVKGPNGKKQIVWYSVKPGRTETFREIVDNGEYIINGMGQYGQTMMLMTGTYKKVNSN